MLRKLTLAAVAAASLGVMALAPTSASAGGFWPHHHHHHHWGHGHGFGLGFIGGGGGYDGCYVTRRHRPASRKITVAGSGSNQLPNSGIVAARPVKSA